MNHLNWHLTQGGPGQDIHHLAVVRAPVDAVTVFGTVDETKLHTTLIAIAPVGADAFDDLLHGAVVRASAEAREAGSVIVFVTLSQEMVGVPEHGDQELARRMVTEGRPLTEHPDAEEATWIYGVCGDGRRWRGHRYHTGAKAGTTDHVELLIGAPRPGESHGMHPQTERLLRYMVWGQMTTNG